jgi:hypothetical protein
MALPKWVESIAVCCCYTALAVLWFTSEEVRVAATIYGGILIVRSLAAWTRSH